MPSRTVLTLSCQARSLPLPKPVSPRHFWYAEAPSRESHSNCCSRHPAAIATSTMKISVQTPTSSNLFRTLSCMRTISNDACRRGLESVVHGSCRRFFFAPKRREYVGFVPRALALAKKELRLLYNCPPLLFCVHSVVVHRPASQSPLSGRIVLPACWFTAENFDNRRICRTSVPLSHAPQDIKDEPTAASRLVDVINTSCASRDPRDERAYAALALQPILQHNTIFQHDVGLIPRSSTSTQHAAATARSEHHSLYY